MTHPFHPLHGRTFEAISRGPGWAEERVWFQLPSHKRTRAIPVAWTSLALEDPYLTIAKGRSPLRVEDLLQLATLLAEARP